jgi:hypothetical protein
MPGIAAEPEDESMAIAVERMLDDGAPIDPRRRVRRPPWSAVRLQDEPSAAERAALRRAASRVLRLYCFACGRSREVLIAPVRPGRCEHCGGSMLVEVAAPD